MSNLEGAAAPQQAQLTTSGILADLENGLTRDMIQVKYKLTKKDVTDLFKHPALKGKKTKAAPGFILVDDTTPTDELGEEVVGVVEEVQEESQEESKEEVQTESLEPAIQDAPASDNWEEPTTTDSVV